ncbi:MAG: hypothetical protein VB070_05650 [Clostridiaceae bacterium]|nr:hypothetical protein [Clostridiaceae bacterium]
MRKMIRKAFDPIQADQALIEKTRLSVAGVSVRAEKPGRKQSRIRYLAAALVVVMLVSIITVAGLALSNTTVAAVSVDINPSIELSVNALNRVVAVQAFNEDGEAILTQLSLIGKPVKAAVNEIITAAAEAGFLAEDGSSIIAITTSADIGIIRDKLEQDTEEAAQEALEEEEQEAVVYHDNTALNRIEEAHKLGITPGRLNLIQKLIALDPTKHVDDYLNTKASDIMKEVVRLQKARRLANGETELSESGQETLSGDSTQESIDPSESAIKESEKIVRQSEKETRESIKASEKATRESIKESEKAVRESVKESEEADRRTQSGIENDNEIEHAVSQAQANQEHAKKGD